jgi:hypothetical protein
MLGALLLIINMLTKKRLLARMVVSTAVVAQLVRAPDCGSGGRGFEPLLSPTFKNILGG